MLITTRFIFLLNLTFNTVRALGKTKIICTGKKKTGTTSIGKALTELGFSVGKQFLAERLIHDWAARDFRKLFWYCLTAQAFQDIPFSWPFTFMALDQQYPSSKFILTVRDTPEQWYQCVLTNYAVVFGYGHISTLEDLHLSSYVYPGWAYEAERLVSNAPV